MTPHRIFRFQLCCFSRMKWLVGLVGLGVAITAQADERILSYHSDIAIAVDASMTVTETIRVRAEGTDIRRGIYRDFPTRYTDALGNDYVVTFEVQAVTRDGQSESWHLETRSNGVRVYAGSANRILAPGEYSYTLTYKTDRQLGYFADHDELYWNVTGDGWMFPIEQASAHVRLPDRVPAAALAMEGYTGRYGASGRDYEAAVEPGAASITASRMLAPREGLTLVFSFPKGIVFEPGNLDRAGYILRDNLGLLLALATLLLVSGYLFFAWHRHGRDPEAGVTFAHYEPPDGYSPGSVRYITRMGYDPDTLTAAVVNLAVKGYLTISKEDDDYVLARTDSTEPLGPGEAALEAALFKDGLVVTLDDECYELVGAARKAHKKALKRNYYNIYFIYNSHWLVPSFLGSLLVFVLLAAEALVTPLVVLAFVINLAVQALFLYLMRAPTRRGRALLDKLAGFELYLKVAEKDDLNIRHPPELTPLLFERYLPFAIALGVANEWSEQFAAVLSRMEASERMAYAPVWYHGSFHSHQLSSFVADVGSGFSSAIASAATPPGSSSGSGGGGFSGGGGGGGGGGGW